MQILAYPESIDYSDTFFKQQMEQNLNILINSASASVLNDYDDMSLDIFSDANGYDNTINTTNTDAEFNGDRYSNTNRLSPNNMTSNTAPSPYVASSSGNFTSDLPFNAFDGNSSTGWRANGLSGAWIKLDFGSGNEKQAKFIYCVGRATAGNFTATLYGSNDDSSYTELTTISVYDSLPNSKAFTNETAYRYYKLVCSSGDYFGFDEIKLSNFTDRVIETNPETIDANPTWTRMYLHQTIEGDSSITYDYSCDNGVTWVEDLELNEKNTVTHTGGTELIRINLNGTSYLAEAEDYVLMRGWD